ncbi:MAG: DUF2769 domain-containing protein [Halobacteriota archaeon]
MTYVKVENTDENYAGCICYQGDCPTYSKCQLTGGLFCARGKSEKTPERKGCKCPMCPVWVSYALKTVYFCAHGAAR